MYEWLLREAECWAESNPWSDGHKAVLAGIFVTQFILHLRNTAATPCDDCECKAAYVLQELRRGNFTEVPLPKEDNDD